jgi:lysine-N-methylase
MWKGRMMKLYAPQYYKEFRCIADRCEHSCCVGWEIDIDGDTLEKYQSLTESYGAVIAESISMEDTPHFKLRECDRCPHLDNRGLCKIILNLGEDYLCDICREHPRFYNYTDVAEVGLGMSCVEAARTILASPDYMSMEEVGEVSADGEIEFNGRLMRNKVYETLSDNTLGYNERLTKIYADYGIYLEDDEVWRGRLSELEYLDEGHRNLFMHYSSSRRPEGVDEYLERFLAYLIYRHCTEAFDAEDFVLRLSFCLFCERLAASLVVFEGASSLGEVAALASIISEELEYSEENTAALTY